MPLVSAFPQDNGKCQNKTHDEAGNFTWHGSCSTQRTTLKPQIREVLQNPDIYTATQLRNVIRNIFQTEMFINDSGNYI